MEKMKNNALIGNIGRFEVDMAGLAELEGIKQLQTTGGSIHLPRWAWSGRARFWTSAELGLCDRPSVFCLPPSPIRYLPSSGPQDPAAATVREDDEIWAK